MSSRTTYRNGNDKDSARFVSCSPANNSQALRFLLVFVVAFAVFASGVLALGVKPAQTTIQFTPSGSFEGQFNVLRDTEFVSIAQLSVEGPLKDYIHFDSEYITLKGMEVSVHYTIDYPSSLPPGEHTSRILVEEALPDGTGGIAARVLIPFTIHVQVPYPEKFISASLEIIPQGESITVAATVQNLGQQDIEKVEPRVSILDTSNRQIATVPLESQGLQTFQKQTFEKTIDVGKLKGGAYRATALITYDENTVAVVKDFTIGVPIVAVTYKDRFIKYGDVSTYALEIENAWNAPLKGVMATLVVKKGGQELTLLQTDRFDLSLGERKRVTPFVDARSIPVGKYEASIKISYEGGATEDPFVLEVLPEEEYNAAMKSSDVSWTFIGLMALLMINGIIVVYIVTRITQRKTEAVDSAEDAIKKFISNARGMGFSDEEVRQRLKRAGWPDSLIDQGLRK